VIRFRIADLLILILFAALAAAGIRYEDHLAPFGVVAVWWALVSTATARILSLLYPRRTPWIAVILFWPPWSVFCLVLVSLSDLGPTDYVLRILTCVGVVGSAFSAYVGARLARREKR
jgi:hypothetical protein